MAEVSGTFTGTGVSASFTAANSYFDAMVTASSWAGSSVQLERSFDAGVTFAIVSLDAVGTPAVYTENFNGVGFDPSNAVIYQWNCTAYGGSAISYLLR